MKDVYRFTFHYETEPLEHFVQRLASLPWTRNLVPPLWLAANHDKSLDVFKFLVERSPKLCARQERDSQQPPCVEEEVDATSANGAPCPERVRMAAPSDELVG
jgi:hypothetical protein